MTLSDLAKYSMTRSVAQRRAVSATAELLVLNQTSWKYSDGDPLT